MSEKKTVLFLASNPKGLSEVRSTEERTKIKNIFKRENLKDAFHFESEFQVTIENFVELIRNKDPWLVHFCGHGKRDKGIFLEKRGRKQDGLTGRTLIRQIQDCHSVEGIFLNSCHSGKLADDFTDYVDFFIGIDGEVKNKTAIKFAERFYELFETYETIWFAMTQVEKDLDTFKTKAFKPVLRWNKQKIMLQAKNDIESHILRKAKAVARLTGDVAVDKKQVKKILNDLKQKDNYQFLLKNHPYAQIPMWFDEEREVLVSKVTAKCMSGESEIDKYKFGKSLNRLFGYLDMVIVSYRTRDVTQEEILENLGDDFNKSKYLQALKIVVKKVPKKFSEDSRAFFRDSCKYLTECIAG